MLLKYEILKMGFRALNLCLLFIRIVFGFITFHFTTQPNNSNGIISATSAFSFLISK